MDNQNYKSSLFFFIKFKLLPKLLPRNIRILKQVCWVRYPFLNPPKPKEIKETSIKILKTKKKNNY